MKLFVFSCMAVLAALAASMDADADVYNCSGVWNTRPCDSSAQPAKLPPVSRYSGASEPAKARSLPSPITHNPPDINQVDTRCTPELGGASLRITELEIRGSSQFGENKQLIVGVVRDSDISPLTDIDIVLTSSNGTCPLTRKTIDGSLPKNRAIYQTIALPTTKTGQTYCGSYLVSLEYHPASICDSRWVHSVEGVHTNNSQTLAISPNSRSHELIRRIRAIEDKADQLQRDYRTIKASESHLLQSSKTHLLIDLEAICMRASELRDRPSVVNARESDISQECFRIERRIKSIGR